MLKKRLPGSLFCYDETMKLSSTPMGRTFIVGLLVTLTSSVSYLWFSNVVSETHASFALLLALGVQNLCIYGYGLGLSIKNRRIPWAIIFVIFIILIIAIVGFLYTLISVADSLYSQPWGLQF